MLPLEPQSIVEEARKCVLCGKCLAACPLFLETGKEEDSPRGKLFLIANLSPLTPRAAELIFPCLLCGECEKVCPLEIRIMDVLLSLRFYYKLPLSFEVKELSEKEGKKPVYPGCFEKTPEDGMVPPGLVCSGFYHLLSGDLETYKKCAEQNVRVLKNYPGIEILCPLAFTAISLYSVFFGDEFRVDIRGEKALKIPPCFFNIFPERFS